MKSKWQPSLFTYFCQWQYVSGECYLSSMDAYTMPLFCTPCFGRSGKTVQLLRPLVEMSELSEKTQSHISKKQLCLCQNTSGKKHSFVGAKGGYTAPLRAPQKYSKSWNKPTKSEQYETYKNHTRPNYLHRCQLLNNLMCSTKFTAGEVEQTTFKGPFQHRWFYNSVKKKDRWCGWWSITVLHLSERL